MIPWRAFEAESHQEWIPALPVSLEENYLQMVQDGPSIAAAMFFEPSMLEVAHERRFVVTQQGSDGAGFEVEHAERIGKCITALERHFRHFANNHQHETKCFPVIEHVGLWATALSSDRPPCLELVDDDGAPSLSSSQGLEQQPVISQQVLALAAPADLPQMSAVPSLIDVEDSEGSDNIDDAVLRSSVLADAARARRSALSKSKGARAERQIRKRKQRFDQKDEPPASRLCVSGTAGATFKHWVPTAPQAYRTPTLPSVLSLSTPAGSIFEFANHMTESMSVSEVTAHIGSSPKIDTG